MVMKVLDEAQILSFSVMTENLIEQTGFQVASPRSWTGRKKPGPSLTGKRR